MKKEHLNLIKTVLVVWAVLAIVPSVSTINLFLLPTFSSLLRVSASQMIVIYYTVAILILFFFAPKMFSQTYSKYVKPYYHKYLRPVYTDVRRRWRV